MYNFTTKLVSSLGHQLIDSFLVIVYDLWFTVAPRIQLINAEICDCH